MEYDPKRSVNPELSEGNAIIEGEKLEVLKCLLASCRNRVKCIYIDPPYDKVGTIVWKNATDNNPSNVAEEHEYVLVYCRDKTRLAAVWKTQLSDVKDVLVKKGEELIAEHADIAGLRTAYTLWYRENKKFLWPLDRYKYIDNGGVYTRSQSVHNPGKEGCRYDVPHPVTGKPCKEPLMGYRFPPETMEELLAKERILFGRDENRIIELKVYAHEFQDKLSSVFELDGRLGPYDLKALFSGTAKGLQQSEAGRQFQYRSA